MSYLQLNDPALFKRFERIRCRDERLVEVFDDLEMIARASDRGDFHGAEQIAELIDELKEELRLRIEACEAQAV